MKRNRPDVIVPTLGEKIAGWIYLPFYILGLALILSTLFALLGYDVRSIKVQLDLNLTYGILNFVVLGFFFRRYLLKSARQVKAYPGRFFIALAGCLAIYFFGSTAMEWFTRLIDPALKNVNDASITAMTEYGLGKVLLFALVLAPVAEELLFRGLIFSSIHPHSRFWAYAVSMLAFSFIHVLGYVGSYPPKTLALCFLQYLPASFGLAWALEYSGSIWCCFCVHLLSNTIALLLQ